MLQSFAQQTTELRILGIHYRKLNNLEYLFQLIRFPARIPCKNIQIYRIEKLKDTLFDNEYLKYKKYETNWRHISKEQFKYEEKM